MNAKPILIIIALIIVSLAGVFSYNLHQPLEVDRVVDVRWLETNCGGVKIVAVGSDQSLFKRGYIPRSSFISYQDLIDKNSSIQGLVLKAEDFERLMSHLGVSEKTSILLYDNQSGLFAARAYWTLYYYGHKSILFLDGGVSSWIKAGLPLESTTTSSISSQYKIGQLNSQSLATLTYVKSHLYDPHVVIIDARSESEYSEGHIPNAIHIEWSATLTSEGLFKNKTVLKELFAKQGITPEKTIVTYCRTGVRGAHMWFVLSQILKYPNVMLYDGSWEEWLATSQPIER